MDSEEYAALAPQKAIDESALRINKGTEQPVSLPNASDQPLDDRANKAASEHQVTLSLVIPCYNEERTLRNLVESILQLQNETLALELVIVDDYSTDRSREIAQALATEHSEVKLCCHAMNLGKGAALRTGFMAASGDFVGIQDADLEYNPRDYLRMVRLLMEEPCDVVLGSRYLRRENRSVLRWWHSTMNRFLTLASNFFTDMDLSDMETCYKLFRRDIIQKIAPKLVENRFGFEPEVVSWIAKGVRFQNWRLRETAIDYYPRRFDEGKKIGWKDGIRALVCILKYNWETAPFPAKLSTVFAAAVILLWIVSFFE